MSAQCEGAPAAELEALLRFLYLCPVGVIKLAGCGRVDMMNPMAAQLLMPLARPGTGLEDLFVALADYAPELRQMVSGFDRPHGTICESYQVEVSASSPSRKGAVLAITLIKVDADCLMAVLVDVSRLVAQERIIRAREERLRAIFDGIRDYAIYTLDRDGRVDSWNRSVQRVQGYTAEEALGQPLGFDCSDEARAQAWPEQRLRSARESGWHEDEGWRVRRDGSRFWANSIVSVLQDGERGVAGYSVITRDITERKHAEDALRRLALTDALTGLYNRRFFFEQAEKEAGLSLQSRGSLAFLILDADHFKRINDRYGHAVGDAVLKELASVCSRCVRSTDVLARYGGEEFVIMLRQTALPDALAVAERIRQSIAQCAVASGGETVRFTVSIGVASLRRSVQDAIHRADQALYAAKQQGRNRVAVASEEGEGARRTALS